ncbi:hypothetical protein YC2023_066027 [Brassica napus]
MASEPGRAQLENRTSSAFELYSGEASSAMDRGQFPGKGRQRGLNMGERPIANKYHEVKMKRTLKRESQSA